MRETLERLSKIKAPVCVSIIVKTYRTHPENEKDAIRLKNLIAEADQRLQKEYGQDIAKKYTDKLKKLAEEIDHRHNDLGLMLFVNDDVSEYLRIPIEPHSRVILDETFTTRPIIRALKRANDYYILVLSRGKARLIEASSDKVVKEHKEGGFPASDQGLLKTSNEEGSSATRVSNLTSEFFNRIDKHLNALRNKNPLPVVVATLEANYPIYMKEADNPNTILGQVNLKNMEDPAHKLVTETWPFVKELTLSNQRSRVSELERAIGSGKCLVDLNEIWEAVQKGRGKTIFVEEGFFQPVKNENGILTPIQLEEVKTKEDINDIVDEMIEHTLQFGGDVVFLEKGSLEKFNKMALITRY